MRSIAGRIPIEDYKKLEEKVEKLRVSMSQMVKIAIKRYLVSTE